MQIIRDRDAGIFHLQDPQFFYTTSMVCTILKAHGKKLITSSVGVRILKKFIGKTGIYKKVFGDLYECRSLSGYKDNSSYQKFSVEEAIKISEKE